MLAVSGAMSNVGEPQRPFLSFARVARVPAYVQRLYWDISGGSMDTLNDALKLLNEYQKTEADESKNDAQKKAAAKKARAALGKALDNPPVQKLMWYATDFPWPGRRVKALKVHSGGSAITQPWGDDSPREGEFKFIVDEPHTMRYVFDALVDLSQGSTMRYINQPDWYDGLYNPDNVHFTVKGSDNWLAPGQQTLFQTIFDTGKPDYMLNELSLDLFQVSVDRATITDFMRLRWCTVLAVDDIRMTPAGEFSSLCEMTVRIAWDWEESDLGVPPGDNVDEDGNVVLPYGMEHAVFQNPWAAKSYVGQSWSDDDLAPLEEVGIDPQIRQMTKDLDKKIRYYSAKIANAETAAAQGTDASLVVAQPMQASGNPM